MDSGEGSKRALNARRSTLFSLSLGACAENGLACRRTDRWTDGRADFDRQQNLAEEELLGNGQRRHRSAWMRFRCRSRFSHLSVHPYIVEPPWSSRFDAQRSATADTRNRFFTTTANSKTTTTAAAAAADDDNNNSIDTHKNTNLAPNQHRSCFLAPSFIFPPDETPTANRQS